MYRLLPLTFFCIAAIVLTVVSDVFAQHPEIYTVDPSYVENRGQWDAEARYQLSTPGLNIWLGQHGIMFDQFNIAGDGHEQVSHAMMKRGFYQEGQDQSAITATGHAIRMTFEHALDVSAITGVDRSSGYSNYFIGNNAHHWVTEVPHFSSVRINAVYNGIDALFYLDHGQPRYDFVIEPYANPAAIGLRFEGATRLYLTESGDLSIVSGIGELHHKAPIGYQIINGERQAVSCNFVIDDQGIVHFQIGAYNPSLPLIIDPLIYSTFVGGNGLHLVANMGLDAAGNMVIAGTTTSSNFPTTTGAYQTTFNKTNSSSAIMFVTKLNAAGSALLFSTYIGGASSNDICYGMALDTARNVYLTGRTTSVGSTGDFPTTSNAFRTTRQGGIDAVVVKLNSTGSSLGYSTFLGGPGTDYGFDITVDKLGNAYVAGQTDSTFPTTTGAYAATRGGMSDNFVTKLNASGGSLLYSTYIGGESPEAPLAIAIDSSGNAYIAGQTASSGYPTTTGAFDRTKNTANDAFISKLNSTGSTLLYSTFLGGTSEQSATHIVANNDGSAVILGWTSSSNFPTTTSGYDTSYNGGNQDIFLTKINSAGSSLVYSTYLGSNWDETGTRLALDFKGNVHIVGNTSSTTFPTTTTAFDQSANGSEDTYVVKLNSTASRLLYSTYIGGSDGDFGVGIQIDTIGNAFIAGYTYSTDFPTTNGAYSTTNAFSAVFALKLPVPTITLKSPIEGETLCTGTPYTIRWTSSAVDTVTIEVSSNGGSTWSTLVSRIPSSSGTWSWSISPTLPDGNAYRIRIYDPMNVLISDTSRTGFSINRPPSISRSPSSLTMCAGAAARFSVNASGSSITYQWRKNNAAITGATDSVFTIPTVQASDSGNYDVVITGICAPPATSTIAKLTVNTPPTIISEPTGDTVCQGEAVTLKTTASGSGLKYRWRKNGATITGATNAIYSIGSTQLSDTGIYDVIVEGTCTPSDTSRQAILSVLPVPTITRSPANVTLCAGETATFHVAVTGTNIKYQWRRNGTEIPGATDSILILSNVGVADAGTYDVDITGDCPTPINSNDAVLTVKEPPVIIAEPANTTVCSGEPTSLWTVATGTDLTYQWRKKGVPITGATSAMLDFSVVTASDTGSYDVIITGSCQPPDTSAQARLSLTQSTAITIASQSSDTTVCSGERLVLNVQANGASLNYQWRHNGASIPGARAMQYVIPSIAPSDTGAYDVVIGSACGTPVTSNKAQVTLLPPTIIESGPEDIVAIVGANKTFEVMASGAQLRYQWRKDGMPIPGATELRYTINPVQRVDSGTYDVIVTGLCGLPDTSNSAILTVLAPSSVPGTSLQTIAPVSMRVIPHPANNRTQIFIQAPELLKGGAPELHLYDALGNLILELNYETADNSGLYAEFDATAIPSGIYFCHLITHSGRRAMGVVVVTH